MSENEGEETQVIMMTDDNDVETAFAMLSVVEIDDKSYAVLAPVEQLESESPDLDLYAFLVTEDGEDMDLSEVEDEELFNKIMDLAEQQWIEDEDLDDAEFAEE